MDQAVSILVTAVGAVLLFWVSFRFRRGKDSVGMFVYGSSMATAFVVFGLRDLDLLPAWLCHTLVVILWVIAFGGLVHHHREQTRQRQSDSQAR